MKTKLLRRVRKEYSIVYYPHTGWYTISHPHDSTELWSIEIYATKENNEDGGAYNSRTMQGAKDKLMVIIRHIYRKYSREYRLSQVKQKVWHNS